MDGDEGYSFRFYLLLIFFLIWAFFGQPSVCMLIMQDTPPPSPLPKLRMQNQPCFFSSFFSVQIDCTFWEVVKEV